MRLQSFIIWSVACLLASLSVQAQPNRYGVPLITNYHYGETGGNEQNWCITQDHRGVVYVGNYDKGVLEFDGVEWRTIPVPGNVPVWSLVTGDDGVVYVGLESDFGMLEPDEMGQLHFQSLYDSLLQRTNPIPDVWKTYFDEGKVYFCSSRVIFKYDPVENEMAILETSEYPYFAFVVDHKLYISDFEFGLMIHDGESFVSIPGGDQFMEMSITGVERFNEDQLLVSTMFKGIYLFNPGTGAVDNSFINPALMEEFSSIRITFMRLMGDNILVCTTNGLYILNRMGEIKEIISDSEGLLENSISQVYTDERLKGSGPLWIAHWKGVSKVEANIPFRVFTERSGFENLITDIAYFNGHLYVSTMGGLFRKSSMSSSTRFQPVPEIQVRIEDLQVLEPVPGNSLLLVASDLEIFSIDENMRVSIIHERMVNPPATRADMEQIAGRHILVDPDKPDVIYTGINEVVGLQYTRGRWKETLRIRDLGQDIFHLAKDKFGYLWVSTLQYVIQVDISLSQQATMKSYTMEHGLPADVDNCVFLNPETEEVLVGTLDGFYRFNYFLERFVFDSVFNSMLPPGTNLIRTFHKDLEGDYWFSFENQYSRWKELLTKKEGDRFKVISETPFERLPPAASTDVFCSDPEKGIWFSKSDELYHFDKYFSRNDTLPFQTLIRKVVINSDSVLYHGSNFKKNNHGGYTIHLFQDEDTQPIIKYRFNNIEFHWAAPYFEQEKQLQYSYKLLGFSDDWSEWHKASFKEFTNLKYGKYTLFVKAMNVYGYESEAARYSFIISRPWHASIPAIISYILLSGLLIYVIIKLYTRRLKQENLRLEGIIEERTAEIRKQKEELTDSIEYASRIQRALLPSDFAMEEHNIEHFILFRPRDIVSGDFYWMGSKDDKLLIVAADCTGHGVPGAFMSMLGMTFLDEIVIKSEITSTDEIMESLREHVINSLEQSGKSQEEAVKDGMDLSMISVDMKSQIIQYSGAYNPLYLVRKLKRSERTKLKNSEELDLPRGSIHNEEHLLLQIRADQMPIGVSEKDMRFNATTIKDEGYNIYMFSDGFLDQFGGPQGKKFMSKNFKKLLLELQSIPLKEQGAALEKVLLGWMGEISQIDDILVMGLRMNPM